jgi:hypothetical protein
MAVLNFHNSQADIKIDSVLNDIYYATLTSIFKKSNWKILSFQTIFGFHA